MPERTKKKDPRCHDSRTCFARKASGICSALSDTYQEDGSCPFRKRLVTDKALTHSRDRLELIREVMDCQEQK